MFEDLTGKRFGKLTVTNEYIDRVFPDKRTYRVWKCICDCGKEINAFHKNLLTGYTRSCGCLRKLKGYRSPLDDKQKYPNLYQVWTNIKQRCLNCRCKEYKNYGARGIKVCDDWIAFYSFLNWALANGYKEGLTIDRIDVNGNYEPSNCRWATMKEQSRNKRNNIFLTFNGETHCVADWAEKLNISITAFNYRRKRYLAGLMTEKELFKIKE